jgi:hypothetical protein
MTAVSGLVLILACGDPLAVTVVTLDVDGSVIVSPNELEAFHVTAVNSGDERVVWGSGSSSCQLGLVVLDARESHNIDFRVCTMDLVEQGLDPGESRTETFSWGGTIIVDQEIQVLPSGQYRVFGVAGDRGQSEPLLVTVLIP